MRDSTINNPKNDLLRRYILYVFGLYVFSFGIALVARSCMGATPVSSWAYTMSRHTSLTYGTYSFLIHLAMIAYQMIIMYGHGLKKEWHNIALQIPFSFVFGVFLDLNMLITSSLHPTGFIACLCLLLLACMVHAMGVYLQVCANVTMMSAEAFVYYTCKRWNLFFWRTKIKFDVSMVTLAIITSLVFDFSFESVCSAVREGTVIDALLVGRIYHFYSNHIKIFNRNS
ncbi:MAG: YitT family protein [Prevotella sp.]